MSASLLFLNSDSRILEQIRSGDDRALVTLVEANKKPITAYITRNSGQREDAEDVVQEAVVVVWERIRSGRFHYSASLSTFVFAIAKNMWLRRLARRKREIPMPPNGIDIVDDQISSLDKMMEDEQSTQLSRAVDELGEPCRTILLLFYYEECSMEEIAEKMGFANADTVKSKKYQCKKALEKAFSHGS